MRHESKFSTWIRTGGHSTFVLAPNSLAALESKFSVVPDRLLDSILDDALAGAVGRLNQYLQGDVSIDINAVDLTSIRDQLRGEVADRLTEIGVAVNPNDPVITSIIARYAEVLNGFFQTEALHVERYIWRSRDDSRVRAAHAEYDDQIFSWSDPPEGGHPGQGWGVVRLNWSATLYDARLVSCEVRCKAFPLTEFIVMPIRTWMGRETTI